MNIERLSRLQKVLIGPLVSEKATAAGERENSFAFLVHPDSNKRDIKQAVEHFFPNVKVLSVRTSIRFRDFKKVGNRIGRMKKVKAAFVKLAKGTEIQLNDFE